MSTVRVYLQELSDLFLADLRASRYYHDLPSAEQAALERRLGNDAAEGFLPLVPGASEGDLDVLSDALWDALAVGLPDGVRDMLREVDGFVENGTTLFSVDAELVGVDDGSRPGLLAENQLAWGQFGALANRWLVVGDNELSLLACELATDEFWALDKYTFTRQHRFPSACELLEFLLRTALRLPDPEPAADEESPRLPPESWGLN